DRPAPPLQVGKRGQQPPRRRPPRGAEAEGAGGGHGTPAQAPIETVAYQLSVPRFFIENVASFPVFHLPFIFLLYSVGEQDGGLAPSIPRPDRRRDGSLPPAALTRERFSMGIHDKQGDNIVPAPFFLDAGLFL